MKYVCVYCGSSDNVDQKYFDAARQMGVLLANREITLVYGGGSSGLMGAIADSALSSGGEVIGVTPEFFFNQDVSHQNLTRLEVVADMHQRKARMADLADAFIALPGGLGTLEELFEILSWSQIGLHVKPVGLLNVNRYYDPLLAFLKQVSDQGFTYSELNNLYLLAESPEEMMKKLDKYQPPANSKRSHKWGG